MGVVRILSLGILLVMPFVNLMSQTVGAAEMIQIMMEEMAENGTLTEDIENEAAELLAMSEDKIDLNEATAEQLEHFFFLTPEQRKSIITHRERFGPYRSEAEFTTMRGFSFLDAYKILLFSYIGYSDKDAPRRQQYKLYVTARTQRLLPDMKGFKAKNDSTPAPYLGNAYKKYLRIEGNAGEYLQGGLIAESDPGEPVFSHGISATDFVSGYLQYNGRRNSALDKVLVGHYSARFGQGLGLWTGFAADLSSVDSSTRRHGNRIHGNMSASESGYLRGMALSFSGRKFQADMFFSHTDNDASMNSSNDTLDNEVFATTIRDDGYHRTEKELEGRNNYQQILYGGYMRYSWVNTILGIGFNQWHASAPLGNKGELYKMFYPRYSDMGTMHADYYSHIGRFSLYGEIAGQSTKGWGVVQGMNVRLGSENLLTVALRTMDKRYYSIFQNPVSHSSQPGGESGVYIGLNVVPLNRITLLSSVDVYRHQWLRYLKPAPTSGFRAKAKITYKLDNENTIALRLTNDDYDDSDRDDRKRIERTNRMDARLVWTSHQDGPVALRTTVERVHYRQDNHKSHGFWIGENVTLNAKWCDARLSMMLAHFDTDDYYSRIYSSQPDVLYSMSTPSYSGRGIVAVANGKLAPTRRLIVWLWGRYVKYYDRDVIGTGNDETEGSHRMEMKLQVKVKLYKTGKRKI
ncbi:MAG: helix-hairpin-helix domain-containing protein [Bacteroidales bacterium]|nr:helix-hairpin-helix domain-containing protein [Bacteroidales bacterium]